MIGWRMASSARALGWATVGLLVSTAARAQAWLPPEGEAWLSLGYGNIYSNRHYLGTPSNPGDSVQSDFGHIRSQSAGIQVGYVITDRFALSVGIPFITSKYEGDSPHNASNIAPDQGHIDDGLYHGVLQDFTVALRYQAITGPVVVTPFAVAVIPSHSYTYFAHSAAGRDLHEYWLGLSLGARLDRVLAGSYVEASYSYAFVERVLGIYHDRSDFFLEAGYFLTPSLGLRFIGTGTYTHGGLLFEYAGQPLSTDLRIHHDQVAHSEGIMLGGGLSYVLTGSTELYAAYVEQVLGRSGHKVGQSLSFGVSWSFSPQQIIRQIFADRNPKGPTEP